MTRPIIVLYAAVAALCLGTPYLASLLGLSQFALSPTAVPVAWASVGLGCAAWSRGASGWPEAVAGALWGVGATAMVMPLSAPSGNLEWLFAALEIQGYVVGVAAVGAVTLAIFAIRSQHPVASRVIDTLAALGLAGLAGWCSLRLLRILPADGSLLGILAGIRTVSVVSLVCASLLIGSAVLHGIALLQGRRRRPTRSIWTPPVN